MAHLLTPELGKISAVARHARGSRKRFPAALDLFDRGTAVIGVERSGILALKSFTPVHSLTAMRRDLDKLTLASTVAELFDLVVQEKDDSASLELFQLFDLALNAIDEASDLRGSLKALTIACLRIGAISGYLAEEDCAPSVHTLKGAIIAAERFVQRKLLTKPTTFDVIQRFIRDSQSGTR